MKCPKCGSYSTGVYDTRLRQNDTARWRRHKCDDCGYRWSTMEMSGTKWKLVRCSECICAEATKKERVFNCTYFEQLVGDNDFCSNGVRREE